MRFLKFFTIICIFALSPRIAQASVSNEPIQWGFKKSVNEQPVEAGAKLDALLEKYGGFYKGDPKSKSLYLTFDNGYENGYTPKILAALKKEKVPAAFFVTGHYLLSEPELVKQMVKEGHIVGNHSWFHPDLTTVSDVRIKEELEKVRVKTKELTGQKEMKFVRPPKGVLSERTLDIAKQEGYSHIMWSIAYVDWNVNQQRGSQYAYDSIMRQIHPGAVILLHTVSKDNADALEKIIQDTKRKGYEFKSLNELSK